jgi:fucose permease
LALFLVGTITLALGLAAIAAVDWPITCALLIGVIGSVHPSVIMAAGTLSARPENRAVGMSLFYTTYYVGGTIVPTLCGRAADLYGGAEGALYAAALVALLAIPAFLLHRRLRVWARVPGLS